LAVGVVRARPALLRGLSEDGRDPAGAIADEIGRVDVDYRPVESGGAARAAALIGELL
jgi:hypothetical protein